MKTIENKPISEEDKEYLRQLEEWAAGSDEQQVPELLMASLAYPGLFDDDLINQLLERLYEVEKQPRIWLQYAYSILSVYKKAENDTIKLKFLSYIYSYNERIEICWQKNCNPVIKGAGLFFRKELPSEIKKLHVGN
jgi:hypothetical protein